MPLSVITPTPPDIDVAQASSLVPIVQVAKDLGLTEDDFSSYGKHLAKASPQNFCKTGVQQIGA